MSTPNVREAPLILGDMVREKRSPHGVTFLVVDAMPDSPTVDLAYPCLVRKGEVWIRELYDVNRRDLFRVHGPSRRE